MFSNVFSPRLIVSSPFDTLKNETGIVSAAPWYLSGGISASNCVAAYQSKGAASLAASYTNLANPGVYNLTVISSAPTWDAVTGWGGFSLFKALDTGVVPAAAYSFIIRFSNASATNSGVVIGAYDGGSKFARIYPTFSSKSNYSNFSGNVAGTAAQLATGVLAVAGNKGYRNGVVDATITQSAATIPSLYIGNQHGSNNVFTPGEIQAVAIYDVTLTAPQVLAVTTAMQAL